MTFLKQLAKRLLRYEARIILQKYKPKIIAITGSVGKTLTREAVYLTLSKKFFIRKSEKSFTAELGIPLTVIGCANGSTNIFQSVKNLLQGLKLIFMKSHYPDILILEVDNDKMGDLEGVKWLRPDILIMTAIGEVPAHIELFPSIEDFLSEKMHIIDSVKRNGTIIYNQDDKRIFDLLSENATKKISCGLGSGAEVSGSKFEIMYGKSSSGNVPTGMCFDIKKNSNHKVTIFDALGESYEYACMLAFATGIELGLEEEEIALTLSKFSKVPGRMSIVPGLKECIIIDDSYNASPVAMTQAVEVLKDLAFTNQKIAVIGDMLEIGKHSAIEHKKVAEILKDVATFVITVGIRSRKINEELLDLGWDELKIKNFDMSEEAGKELQNMLQPGDVVLVKGSQAMRMEKTVEEIMKYPMEKSKVLVRQEREWIGR